MDELEAVKAERDELALVLHEVMFDLHEVNEDNVSVCHIAGPANAAKREIMNRAYKLVADQHQRAQREGYDFYYVG